MKHNRVYVLGTWVKQNIEAELGQKLIWDDTYNYKNFKVVTCMQDSLYVCPYVCPKSFTAVLFKCCMLALGHYGKVCMSFLRSG